MEGGNRVVGGVNRVVQGGITGRAVERVNRGMGGRTKSIGGRELG